MLMKVKVLEKGESFGEQALISNKPRLATVICEENTHFAVLSKNVFDDILLKVEENKFKKQLEFLTTKFIFK